LIVREDLGDHHRSLTVFARNRSLTEEMRLRVTVEGFATIALDQELQWHDADLKSASTTANPDRVTPSALARVGRNTRVCARRCCRRRGT